jgi:hypothetical protein
MLQSHTYTSKQSKEEVDVIDQQVKPTIKKECYNLTHAQASKRKGGVHVINQ